MRYRKPSTEVEAIQWTGTNLEELQGRFGADRIRLLDVDNEPGDSPDPLLELTDGNVVCYVRPSEWVIGERREDGTWDLTRQTDAWFQAQGFKPAYPDRNDHYVPDGLHLDGRPQFVEVSELREIDPQVLRDLVQSAATLLTGAAARLQDAGQGDDIGLIRQWLAGLTYYEDQDRPPRRARLAMAHADEHNRDQGHWWWADMSGEPFADGRPHWSAFRGHRTQVDITLTTANRREVNTWKGRDEIRGGGEWKLLLNRQPVYGGHFGTDVFYALRQIEEKLRTLTGDMAPGLNHTDPRPYAEQLLGRRIYYDRTPAVIVGTVLSQGCVVVKPVGLAAFPRPVHDLDAEPDGTGHGEQDLYEEAEHREVKVEIDSPLIWWWRSRPFGPDEPDGRYHRRDEAGHAVRETQVVGGDTDDPALNVQAGAKEGTDDAGRAQA